MALFDVTDPDADQGYRNIQAAEQPSELARIRESLESFWLRYEPYADGNFRQEFARQPDARFWEMYLTVRLLARKKLSTRVEVTAARAKGGPDICIRKGKRKIWIEAIAPEPGDDPNLDRIPDLLIGSEQMQDVPKREVELRITSALLKKTDAFRAYREKGIVGDNDSCVVAVSASQFALQAAKEGLPYAVTAVYPFGDEFFVLDRAGQIVHRGHHHAGEIARINRAPVKRSAFQHKHFESVSGLIWSCRSIGNFLGQADDFVYIHNQAAQKPIPRKWIRWVEEYAPIDQGKQLRVFKRGR
jgi:hypothetical protein